MSVAGLTRLIPVGWKGETRALVDLLADRHAFEASPSQRDEIARRADALLSSPSADEETTRERKFDLAAAEWKTRAEAASKLAADGAWTPWTLAGSVCVGAEDLCVSGDARLASAIALAARETLLPALASRHERLRGTARAALMHEKDGARHWAEAARPVVAEFAKNARLHGADRRTAALRALSAAAHLKGQALASEASSDHFLLGAAASALARGKDRARDHEDARLLKRLVQRVVALNDARAELWEDAEPEATRLMGAAAAFAAFGTGSLSAPHPRASRTEPFAHLPSHIERYAHLTAAEAAAALDDAAADPRIRADRRRRMEAISDALRRHPSAHAVSCAEALGMDAPAVRTSGLMPGMKVYRASPDGRRRPRVCEGRNGRLLRCRTVAAPDGAVVGSLAFDALSREFGGRPLYAAYALDGSRYGYAWAEGRPVIRRGEPAQGFMTAPERIPV